MLKQTIREDFTSARKNGDATVKNTLEAVIAGILQLEKTAAGKEVTDDEVIACVTKEIKVQREVAEMYINKDAAKSAEAANRVEILTRYLPAQLSEAEVLDIIKKADIYEDASPKTKGMIIKTIMPLLAGKFDKALVNPLVEKYLAGK